MNNTRGARRPPVFLPTARSCKRHLPEHNRLLLSVLFRRLSNVPAATLVPRASRIPLEAHRCTRRIFSSYAPPLLAIFPAEKPPEQRHA